MPYPRQKHYRFALIAERVELFGNFARFRNAYTLDLREFVRLALDNLYRFVAELIDYARGCLFAHALDKSRSQKPYYAVNGMRLRDDARVALNCAPNRG